MKKLILLILLIPSILFAGPLQQAHKKVIASQTGGSDGETYDFFYNSDHPSGNTYAYIDGGNSSLNATISAGTVVVGSSDPGSSSDDGGNVYKQTAANNYARFTVTSGNIFNSAEGYAVVEVYIPTMTGYNSFFESEYDGNNYLRVYAEGDGNIRCKHKHSGSTTELITTASITAGQWDTIEVRWSASGNTIQCRINGGSWEDSSGIAAFATEPPYLDIGEKNSLYTETTYTDAVKIWTNYGQN